MNISELQHYAPSVFAQGAYREMSDKYKFIPTSDIVERLLKEGFVVSRAFENRVRLDDKRGYAKHMLRLRHTALAPQVGDLIPEVILTNSHDGTSAFQLSAGLYRLVCRNGLTVGNDMVNVRQRHSGHVDDVIEGVFRVLDDIPEIIDTAKEWQTKTLTAPQQLAFAKAALPLRWEADINGNYPVNPSHLLTPIRWADKGDDLWRTFNRVQEHIIKGGIRAQGTDGRRRRSRAVTSVNEDQRLNKALWTLAAELAKEV